MSTAKIASVHFAQLIEKRVYRGQPYVVPAVPRGAKPIIVEVYDLMQREWGQVLPQSNKRQELRYGLDGLEIANDVVGHWTGTAAVGLGMNPQSHPGVWVVRDRIPVIEQIQKLVNNANMTYEERMVVDQEGKQTFRPATEDELKTMFAEDELAARAADRAYAEWCWNDGNRIYNRDKHNQLIPPLYKEASRHYGLDAEWLKEAASTDHQECPNCQRLVPKSAIVCRWCTEPVDLHRWAEWQKRKKDALESFAPTEAVIAAQPEPGAHGIRTRG